MSLVEIDGNSYMFYEQDTKVYKYRHKYLVAGTEKNDLGMDEKWSGWTKQTAREYAFANGVDIVQTRKKPV